MNDRRRHLAAVPDLAVDLDPEAEQPVRSAFDDVSAYPELVLVLSLARSAVVEAYDIDERAQPDLVEALERAAAAAMVAAYAPAAAAAARLALMNENSRAARAATVARTAERMARRTEGIAAALKRLDDAYESTAAATFPGDLMADACEATASLASRRGAAAVIVAAAAGAARAATQVAIETAAAAVTLDTFEAAVATRSLALTRCYELGIDAAASVAHRALLSDRG